MYISSAWEKARRGAHFFSARLKSTSRNSRITTAMINDIATRSVPSATISVYSFQMQTSGIRRAPIRSARSEIPAGRPDEGLLAGGRGDGATATVPRVWVVSSVGLITDTLSAVSGTGGALPGPRDQSAPRF